MKRIGTTRYHDDLKDYCLSMMILDQEFYFYEISDITKSIISEMNKKLLSLILLSNGFGIFIMSGINSTSYINEAKTLFPLIKIEYHYMPTISDIPFFYFEAEFNEDEEMYLKLMS